MTDRDSFVEAADEFFPQYKDDIARGKQICCYSLSFSLDIVQSLIKNRAICRSKRKC